MQINTGDRGCDFLDPYPDIGQMQAAQVRWVMFYLKDWHPSYIPQLEAAHIGGLPISEHGETSSLQGGRLGAAHGNQAVKDCIAKGVPKGTIVTLTHDTNQINDVVDDYFYAAEQEVRAGGYGFGGYVSKMVVDQCYARGVTFDLITAPAATAWLGGRHRDSHIWQMASRVLYGVRVDPLLCMKPFNVLGPRKPYHPTLPPIYRHTKENTMKVCNSQDRHMPGIPGDNPDGSWSPGKVLYELVDGKLRHIPSNEGPCWDAAEFRPVDNATLDSLPAF